LKISNVDIAEKGMNGIGSWFKKSRRFKSPTFWDICLFFNIKTKKTAAKWPNQNKEQKEEQEFSSIIAPTFTESHKNTSFRMVLDTL
jgi:hypothetical protein